VLVVRVHSGTSYKSIIERSRAYHCEGEVLLQLPHDDDDDDEEQNDDAVDRETLKIECQLSDSVTDWNEENASLSLSVTSSLQYLLPYAYHPRPSAH
jgi:hypothetical protein